MKYNKNAKKELSFKYVYLCYLTILILKTVNEYYKTIFA